MNPFDDHEITCLLRAWNAGDNTALEKLIPKVEVELRRLARSYMDRERAGHTLQPTALVNELYVRLVGDHKLDWKSRTHFFGFAASTMRHILVDHARARQTAKRGGGAQLISLDEATSLAASQEVDLLALHEALQKLARLDPRQARIVDLRAFAGLSIPEAAEVLSVSETTVSRSWASAKAWLYRELQRTTIS